MASLQQLGQVGQNQKLSITQKSYQSLEKGWLILNELNFMKFYLISSFTINTWPKASCLRIPLNYHHVRFIVASRMPFHVCFGYHFIPSLILKQSCLNPSITCCHCCYFMHFEVNIFHFQPWSWVSKSFIREID